MRLATYRFDDGPAVGIVEDDGIADLGLRAPLADLLDAEGRAAITAALPHAPRVPLDPARLLAPIPHPPAILGVGLNYRDHAREVGRELGATPAVFAKLGGGGPPYGDIVRPAWSDTLDYEGELGIVIGRRCHRVAEADAPAVIAGHVVMNDVTMRALAKPDTLVLGKSGPGHAPFGPWLTTADAVPDRALAIRTWVNGHLRQFSNTRELHVGVFALVAWLSSILVLERGTVIATGSPAGSGVGFDPPRWLTPGDTVRVEIDGLGHIEHVVRDA